MSIFKKLFGGKVKYVKTYSHTAEETIGPITSTYEMYRAKTAQEARNFLEGKTVSKQLYYVVVETPEGNWGKDIDGIYKEAR
jgi:hypothetical protein